MGKTRDLFKKIGDTKGTFHAKMSSIKEKYMFFLELSCSIYDATDVGNLISDSSAFSKSSLNIRKFSVHVLWKPGLENIYTYT